jgi:hypothetical protein
MIALCLHVPYSTETLTYDFIPMTGLFMLAFSFAFNTDTQKPHTHVFPSHMVVIVHPRLRDHVVFTFRQKGFQGGSSYVPQIQVAHIKPRLLGRTLDPPCNRAGYWCFASSEESVIEQEASLDAQRLSPVYPSLATGRKSSVARGIP